MMFLVQKLPHMQYNFLSTSYLILEFVRITSLSYYRVKCVTGQQLLRNIFDNINCADQILSLSGVKVPHRRNLIESAIFTVFVIVVYTEITYLLAEKANTTKIYKNLNELHSFFNIAAKSALFYAVMMFLLHFTFVIYIIKQRLQLIRHIVQKKKLLRERRHAWNSCVRLTSLTISTSRNTFNDTQSYSKNMQLAYRCIYDAFCNAKRFYGNFFILNLLVFVLWASITLLFSVIGSDFVYIMSYIVFTLTLEVLPVVLCECIEVNFKYIQFILTSYYCTTELKCFDPDVKSLKKWIYQCSHMDKKFECGYFEIDLNLINVLVNFVSLFIFSMLPSYT